MRDFVTSSCNNNTDSDSGIVAFLYLYMRLFSALPPLAVNMSSEIPIGPEYSLLNKHMNFRPNPVLDSLTECLVSSYEYNPRLFTVHETDS